MGALRGAMGATMIEQLKKLQIRKTVWANVGIHVNCSGDVVEMRLRKWECAACPMSMRWIK